MDINGSIGRLTARFRRSNMTVKIIAVNVAVFVALRIVAIIGVFSGNPGLINSVLDFVQLPSSFPLLLTRPWTLVSYMFAQYDLLHLFFNVIWFYWFGMLFSMASTPRRMLLLYFLGGLGGAIIFLGAYNLLPALNYHIGWLIGSSASVMAIVTATAILMPDFKMNLLFLGAISIKWIAIVTIILVLAGVTGSNAGGELAHIGGILAGGIFAVLYKRGTDITEPFLRLWDKISSLSLSSFRRPARAPMTPPPPPPRSDGRPACSEEDRATLDAILDKIKRSGYAGLSAEERRILFDVSRKIK